MNKEKLNPFPLTNYSGSDNFCNRTAEIRQLKNGLYNGRHTVLLSIRRMGKTVLIQHLVNQIPAKRAICIYCDIQATKNRKQFINALITATWKVIPPRTSWGKQITHFLKSLRPVITYDELTGLPEVSITLASDVQEEATLKQLLEIYNNQNKQVFIAIDEFQQIANYPEANMEAFLRSII